MDVATKVAKLREEATQMDRRAEESFQRSDTDGFVSQWANQIGARKARMQADLLERGGKSHFPCLMYNGEVVAERIYRFPNPRANWLTNELWKLPKDLADKLGRKWIPVGTKSRVQKALGLSEGTVERDAVVVIKSSGTGLSGAVSAYCTIVRKGEED